MQYSLKKQNTLNSLKYLEYVYDNNYFAIYVCYLWK